MTRYIYTIILLLIVVQLQGQIDTLVNFPLDTISASSLDSLKKIEVDDVQVIKSFEVKLGEAKRIGIGPSIEKVIPVENTYKYDITIVPADLEYPDPVIKPLAMNPDEKPNVNHVYGKLGYGNVKSPYADLSYFRHVPELYEFTISAHHYGLDNSDNLANQKYNESSLDIAGKYLLGENLLLSTNLFGNLDNRNLYGPYNQLPANIEVGRKNNLFGINLGAMSAETTENGLNYSATLGLNLQTVADDFFTLTNDHKELDFAPKAYVSKQIGEYFKISLDVNAYITKLTVGEYSESNTTIEANPSISYNRGIFNLSAGADLVNDNVDFSPFVDLELGVKVAEGMQLYVGADQEIMRNNLSSSLMRNPFIIHDNLNFRNSIVKRIYGGLRGSVLSSVTFNISGGYEDIKDHYFYDYNGTNTPTFLVGYTDVKNIAIDANIEFQITETTQVGGVISHNFYDVMEFEDLYNVPAYRYEAYTKVGLLDNKLHVKGSLALAEGVSYLDRVGGHITGNTLTDVSAEVDYFITPNVAVWARGNNLIDNKYEQLEGYPTIGLNVLGGVMFKF